MKHRARPLLVSLLALASMLTTAPSVLAHDVWIYPSATVATAGDWITFDAAASNDLFYFNHRPLPLDALRITAPDGSRLAPQSTHAGKFRSSFDLPLEQKGSYRVALVMDGLLASWKEGEENKRWRGSAADLERQVPKDAKDLVVTQHVHRIETFVTAGAPDTRALAPTGRGIELAPVTHPNDLYAGETARFVVLVDGKPAPELALTVTPGGTRYRDQLDELALRTDAEGAFSITWVAPGMYWLHASLEDAKDVAPPATGRRMAYSATLEVLSP